MFRAVVSGIVLALALSARAVTVIYVAPNGLDTNPGTREKPFASLTRARDEIRALKKAGKLAPDGAVVEIAGGRYDLSETLELTAEDSGTPNGPITYRGAPGETVQISGGRDIKDWVPVTDAAVLARLDGAARGHVVQADLRALGITQYGEMVSAVKWAQSEPGLELFFNDKPMTLARWPNEGDVTIPGFPADATPRELWGKLRPGTSVEGCFLYEGDRPARWVDEPDTMAHGYWFFDWADQRYRIASINPEKKEIKLDGEHHYGFRKGQGYHVYNLLCELDRPGEWYLDREKGILYFWPPADLATGLATVSVLPTVIALNDVSHVMLRGLIIEAVQKTAVTVKDGTDVQLAACVIRNAGSWGVVVRGGTRHLVVGCDIYAVGDGGIMVDAGDRKTLTPAGHVVENCHIHHYSRWNPMYKQGVSLKGVGNRVSHCLFDNAPHMGVSCTGNDHVVEFSEFHSLVYHANDAEAIHGGYDDWTYRGTVVRYNYIHDCFGHEGHGCKAIRLDNFSGGLRIYGNVIERIWCEGGRGAFTLHGSRDTLVENNLFVDCDRAVRIHKCRFKPPYRKLERMPFREAPWSDRYPRLARILDDDPELPKGNVVVRNVNCGGDLMSTDKVAADLVEVGDNVPDQDRSGVMRSDRGIPYLADSSPAYVLGFKPIPVDQIGLYEDELRASWPVSDPVRPAPPRPKSAGSSKGKKRTGPVPKIAASATETAIRVDGVIGPAEWPGPEIPVKESPERLPITGKPAILRVAYDNTRLYVVIRVPIADANKLNRSEDWGLADGAEVCIRRAGKGTPGPTFVLQGFLTGLVVPSPDAGTHAEDIFRLSKAVTFAANVNDTDWVGEWAIPFEVLDVTPAPGLEFGFNLGVHRTSTREWLAWTGAFGPNWKLDNAGILVLE